MRRLNPVLAQNARGSILSLLLLLLIAGVLGLYLYQGATGNSFKFPEWFPSFSKSTPTDERGYMTYEEYVKKKEREKMFRQWKEKLEGLFKGRPR